MFHAIVYSKFKYLMAFDFGLQYDVSYNHCTANDIKPSAVYQFIKRRLITGSGKEKNTPVGSALASPYLVANADANRLANQVEAQYGVGIWVRMHLQRRVTPTQIRWLNNFSYTLELIHWWSGPRQSDLNNNGSRELSQDSVLTVDDMLGRAQYTLRGADRSKLKNFFQLP